MIWRIIIKIFIFSIHPPNQLVTSMPKSNIILSKTINIFNIRVKTVHLFPSSEPKCFNYADNIGRNDKYKSRKNANMNVIRKYHSIHHLNVIVHLNCIQETCLQQWLVFTEWYFHWSSYAQTKYTLKEKLVKRNFIICQLWFN